MNSGVILKPKFDLVKYENNEPEENAVNEETERKKQIEEYFENTEYNADIEMIYCDLLKKSFNFKLKNIKSGESSIKELSIPI